MHNNYINRAEKSQQPCNNKILAIFVGTGEQMKMTTVIQSVFDVFNNNTSAIAIFLEQM